MKAETNVPSPEIESSVQSAATTSIPESVQKTPRTRPYFTLDAWRGVASLWVVLFHVTGMIVRRDSGMAAQALFKFAQYGSLGVQLFFVISGYCIVNAACASLNRPNGTWKFLTARFRRIYPPFWFASIIAAAMFIGFQYLVSRGLARPNVFSEQNYLHQPFVYYFSNITLLQIALRQPSLLSVSWTLCYEIAFYLTIGLVLILFRSRLNAVRLLQALHVITIVCLLILVCAPQWRCYPFDLWPQFGMGIAVYDILQGLRRRLSTAMIGGVSALTLLLCLKSDMPVGAMNASAHLTYGICLGFALLLCLGYRWDGVLSRLLLVRLLAFVGLFSYSLYLVHTLTMRVANQAAGILHLHNPLLLVASVTAFCLAGSYLFYYYCERPFTTGKRGQTSERKRGTIATP